MGAETEEDAGSYRSPMEGNLCQVLYPSDMKRLVDLHRGVPSCLCGPNETENICDGLRGRSLCLCSGRYGWGNKVNLSS